MNKWIFEKNIIILCLKTTEYKTYTVKANIYSLRYNRGGSDIDKEFQNARVFPVDNRVV